MGRCDNILVFGVMQAGDSLVGLRVLMPSLWRIWACIMRCIELLLGDHTKQVDYSLLVYNIQSTRERGLDIVVSRGSLVDIG